VVKRVTADYRAEIDVLKSENDSLKTRITQLENAAEIAEQYSRRNCLRVTGIKENPGESTDEIILNMARAIDADVSLADIDRSHRVGKISATSESETEPPKPRAIIVKFATYRARRSFYKARTKSKTCGYKNIFVNEDLTQYRNIVLYQARKLVREERLEGAWSSDGTILIKDNKDGVHRINTAADLALHDKYERRPRPRPRDPDSVV